MPTTSRSTSRSPGDHDAFTARMHEVLSAYVAAVAERWPVALAAALAERDPGGARAPEDVPAQRLAEACCALRLPDGRAALSAYADEAPALSPEERAALRAFQEPLTGLLFEVSGLRGLCLRVHDGARRRQIEVRTPPKPFPLEAFIRPGALLVCRLAPLRTYFTHLGPLQVIRAEDRPSLAASLQRQLAQQQRSGEEPTLRFLGLSGRPGREN